MNNLTNIYKILSDETRLRILMLLYNEDLCVCQLSGILNLSQPKISKSLSKLRDMQFVQDERKEKFVYYSLIKNDPLFVATLKHISENTSQFPQLIQDLERLKGKELYLNQCCPTCD